MPLHFWLLGGTLALWDNLYLAPRLLATLAGLATIANLALTAHALAGRRAAALAALLIATFPFEVWFSVSGMAAPVFHALLSGAALGLARWWVTGHRRPLVLGALALISAGRRPSEPRRHPLRSAGVRAGPARVKACLGGSTARSIAA
ncbi:MAG: hypothetical protein QJR03_01405 [Sphaerobacter sp.]|nr:hypothetical protein [Sphaerobacter sp.]